MSKEFSLLSIWSFNKIMTKKNLVSLRDLYDFELLFLLFKDLIIVFNFGEGRICIFNVCGNILVYSFEALVC